MEGIEILSTQEVAIAWEFNWLAFWITFVVVFILSSLIAIVIADETKPCNASSLVSSFSFRG